MKILIVIDSLKSGGAQKSLISFLSVFEKYIEKDTTIDILLFNYEGVFLSQVPKYCNILSTPKDINSMSYPMNTKAFWNNCSLRGVIGKISWYVKKAFRKDNLSEQQALWQHWKKFIKTNIKRYDVAISYLQGIPNYYVIDKVEATKKILYIHNEYQKLGFNEKFDDAYFSSADDIVTISDLCVGCFVKAFPNYEKKIKCVANISSKMMISKMAEKKPEEYERVDTPIFVSIGRLSEQKRFDRAISAALILKNKGIDFRWFIIGTGPDKDKLINQIILGGLAEKVILLGVKSNPYPYIKYSDIFVQTSDFEGKSIVVDEAKILTKPIVVTNYATVGNSIQNNVTGIIVERSPEAVAEGIIGLLTSSGDKQRLINNLKSVKVDNEEEIEKYIDLLSI